MTYEGYTIELVEATVITHATLEDVHVVSIHREEMQGLVAWICAIYNLTEGRPVQLMYEHDCYPAQTWQAAEKWWHDVLAVQRRASQ